MDFADLEAQIDSSVKMLILCSPHNPVGRIWTRQELTRSRGRRLYENDIASPLYYGKGSTTVRTSSQATFLYRKVKHQNIGEELKWITRMNMISKILFKI